MSCSSNFLEPKRVDDGVGLLPVCLEHLGWGELDRAERGANGLRGDRGATAAIHNDFEIVLNKSNDNNIDLPQKIISSLQEGC